MPSQRLDFALFVGNSLDGLFHLLQVESDIRFSKKQAEMWTRLTTEHFPTAFGPSQMTSGPEINICDKYL